VLDPQRRRAALLHRIKGFSADVLCLQEVEAPTFAAITSILPGYQGVYEPKAMGKPDGCATFHRGAAESRRLEYDDGTGHVALISAMRIDGHRLGVANTHLRWDASDAPHEKGVTQLRRLLDVIDEPGWGCEGWIVCGDLNREPSSVALQDALRRGYLDAFAQAAAPTCNSHRRPKRIDYLLSSGVSLSDLRAVPAINGESPLPGAGEPSDHVPIGATFEWAST